ncbi:MAG: SRPBCC family protein [Tepidiformaceae bacterium]
MARVMKTIEVDVPVRTAYDQWTQFEEFPRFMEGVESVQQMGDRRLHWCATVAGKKKEWDAEIREQVPDEKIIWNSTSGDENAGMVKFDSLGADKTRVHLEMSYDPEGFTETAGDMLGFVSRRVEGDLRRFKDFIESRGTETGAWRGEIHNDTLPGGHTAGTGSVDEPSGRELDRGGHTGNQEMQTGYPSGRDASTEPVPGAPSESGGMGGEYPERGTTPGTQYPPR